MAHFDLGQEEGSRSGQEELQGFVYQGDLISKNSAVNLCDWSFFL